MMGPGETAGRRPGPWTARQRIGAVALASVAFFAWYLLVAPGFGRGAAAPAGLVVLGIGYLLGPVVGAAAGAIAMPILWLLRPVVGLEAEPPSLTGGALYFGLMTTMGLAGGVAGRVQGGVEQGRREASRMAKQLKRAQEIAQLGYWSLWADGHLEWTDVLWKAFGFTEEPDDVEEAFARIHPDDEPRVRAQIEAMWRDGGHEEDEHRVVLPDGTLRWIAYACEAERDDSGAVVRVFGTGQDITERKEAERLREAQARDAQALVDLLDNLEDCYWTFDMREERGTFSAGTSGIYGRAPEEFQRDPDLWKKVIAPEDRDRVVQAVEPVYAGEKVELEYRIDRPDGERPWIRTIVWPRQEDGAVVSAFGIVRDVSSEKRLASATQAAKKGEREVARLKQVDELKALFLNMAAHELGGPLTPLKLQAAMLAKKHPGEKGIEIVRRNVDRLEVLVADLLDAGRIQAGRLKFEMGRVDFAGVVRDAVAGPAASAEDKGVEWDADVEDGLIVHGDAVRLGQVGSNLMGNAVKFTPEGRVSVRAVHDGEDVVLEVADTGLGMTADQIDGLFEPFAQFHRGETGVHVGTGLGLYITKSIVEHHGGTVHVASPGPGRGTTFTVRLPRLSPQD